MKCRYALLSGKTADEAEVLARLAEPHLGPNDFTNRNSVVTRDSAKGSTDGLRLSCDDAYQSCTSAVSK